MESDSEIGIEAGLEVDDPRVCHLSADRDLEAGGAAKALLQRVLGVPGITGVKLLDGRTIVVESPDTENWPATVERVSGLMREHLAPRRKGPAGATQFGSTLENLWGYFQQLDRFAVKAKAELQKDRSRSLWAFGATALCGPLASQPGPLQPVFSGLGLMAGTVGSYFTKRSSPGEREQQYARSRALAEEAKSEAIKFLMRCEPYDREDAAAQLKERVDRFREAMIDIGEFEDLETSQRLKDLPADWWTMEDYIQKRVKDQSDWYNRKSKLHLKEAERWKLLVMVFGLVAAACSSGPAVEMFWAKANPGVVAGGTWAAAVRNWLVAGADWIVSILKDSTSWMSVLTSMAGAVTSHTAQSRLDFVALTYKKTRARLEALIEEWNDQAKQDPARKSEFVNKFERVLNQEHAQWSQEFNSGGGGALPAPVFDATAAAVPMAVAAGVPDAPAATPPALDGID